MHVLPIQESIERQLGGGKWTEQTALNISAGAEAYLAIGTQYNTVQLYSSQDFYLKFDVIANASQINISNSQIYRANTTHKESVPYDLGMSGASTGAVLHVKQVDTLPSITVRVTLR